MTKKSDSRTTLFRKMLSVALSSAALLYILGCASTPPPEPEPEPVAQEVYIPPEVVVPDMISVPMFYQRARLEQATRAKLDDYINSLESPGKLRFVIEGYTCNQGDPEYNKLLSLWRAEIIKGYMVKKGINEGSIEVIGHGKDNPIESNRTQAGRIKNRRVTITAERAE